jgi:hypothetical protein
LAAWLLSTQERADELDARKLKTLQERTDQLPRTP